MTDGTLPYTTKSPEFKSKLGIQDGQPLNQTQRMPWKPHPLTKRAGRKSSTQILS